MEITSVYFLVLFVASFLIYYLIPHRYRSIFLTIISCLFIASYSINLLVYVILFSFVNYFIGLKIPAKGLKQFFFLLGLFINLLQLLLLKYVSFTINPLFELLNISTDLTIISEFIVPIGVSYFTLQAIGYLINIKMKWETPERNPIHFLLYMIFFPRFISGPIDRSNKFLPQLRENQIFDQERVTKGLRLVLIGLVKKVVIANQLATIINSVYGGFSSTYEYSLWIVLFIQPIYLYFDFSGYTDIALGIARTFGIALPPNFNRPFLSENISNFWKRFHTSLSSWFNDYVFMRLVFRYRKRTKHATTIALFISWMLFGIWHGAGWNFLLLGLLQAVAIYYEFLTKKWRANLFQKMPRWLGKWFGRITTYAFYSVSLVFFFAEDMNSVHSFFANLNETVSIWPDSFTEEFFVLFLAFVFLSIEMIQIDFSGYYSSLEAFWFSSKIGSRVLRWALYFLMITMVLIFLNEVQQFVYFQF